MTKIYIMRHGEAGFSASSDFHRCLTSFGEEQCHLVVEQFNRKAIQFDIGLVSPYLRAQQTFAIIASKIDVKQTKHCEQLTPGGDAHQVAKKLNQYALSNFESILIVSHLPLVGYLVNALCPTITPPMFSTANVACINLSIDHLSEFEWLHHPI